MSLTLRGVLVLAAVVAAVVLAILILTGTHTLADTAHLLAWAVIALAVGLIAAVVPER